MDEDGDKYIGGWHEDQPEGIGSLIKQDGTKYRGGFKDGLFDGEGVLVEDGKRYEGTFKEGKRNGSFVVYDKDGNEVQRGTYRMGLFMG